VQPSTGSAGMMQTPVGDAEVLYRVAEVKLAHRRLQTGVARGTVKGHRQLLIEHHRGHNARITDTSWG
jgi:hypothetical protein